MNPNLTRRGVLGGAAALVASFRSALAQDIESAAPAYDLDPALTYLNHASIGTLRRATREAYAGFVAACESNPWLHIWGGAWDAELDTVHGLAAGALGAGVAAADVCITRSTTEAFSLLAQGLEIAADKEVLYSSLNHVGASAAWEFQAPRRGFRVRRFDFPVRDTGLTRDDLTALHLEQVSDATEVLVLPHVDNVLGRTLDVRRIASGARERGVRWVCVDGAQSSGSLPVDVATLGVDAYVTSAHKWLQGPKGTGLLHVPAATRAHLAPMFVTWGQQRWRDSARRYTDYGTRDLPKVLALGVALAHHALPAATHHRGLDEHARARTAADPRLRWRSSPSADALSAPLFAVEVTGTDVAALARTLFEEHQIVLRAFPGGGLDTLRISPGPTDTNASLDRLFDVLPSLLR